MKKTIAIAANFTIEPIAKSLEPFLSRVAGEHDVQFAPFDQVFQQLIDPTSVFNLNASGVNSIFLRLESLFSDRTSDSGSFENGRANIEELKSALDQSDSRCPLFLFVCAASVQAMNDLPFREELIRAENELRAFADAIPNLYVFGSERTLSRYKLEKYDNPTGNALAHVPYTDEYYAALGIELARSADALFRKPHKVLVLDCDNTLWDGVVGEDGPDSIGLPENRLALQRFAVRQSKEGMVVCLCSKNNEADVWEAFNRRTEMPLKKEHLVSWKINWEPKSVNLLALADELQLGLDSFIFVDDDPAVCSEVEANCPEVCTILLPNQTEGIVDLLEHLWLFDRLKVTKEDKGRSESYQREVARRGVQKQSRDLESFLESLQLVCEIDDMRPDQIARVSQLSLRTNQFNSTTMRRSEAEIEQLVDAGKRILTVSVHDRFGDYGLVGAVTYESVGTSLHVDSFMLSCRALGRGVEHQILRHLGQLAMTNQLASVDIEFARSEKNTPILNFLNDLEATQIENNERSIYRVPGADALKARPMQKVVDDIVATSTERSVEQPAVAMSWKVYSDIANEILVNGLRMPEAGTKLVDRKLLSTPLVEPRTETETRLAKIWRSQLGISNLGVLDNFFELGADSLVGVSVFVEIEQVFKRSLPLSVLIGSPTIADLAQHLEEAELDVRRWKYLVPVQAKGNHRPLFCMHAAGGNVLFYRDLAKELGDDQPVYGLQARGVADKTETAHDRVEDMAAEYLAEIRSLQENGPYRLCGSSFGGLVAFEAARQLTAMGEKVEILAMFDTYAPGYLQNEISKPSNSPSEVVARLRNLNNQIQEIGSARERLNFMMNRLKKLKMRLKRKAIWKRNEFAIQYNKATGKELPVDLQRNHKAIQQALDSYVPGQYQGSLLMFRATDQPKNFAYDPHLGWGKFTSGQITDVEVKGSHGALTMYPFAADLAEKLKPFMETPVAAQTYSGEIALSAIG